MLTKNSNKYFICTKCKRLLPQSDFYKNTHGKTGYRPSCKNCDRISRDKENRRAYEKKYREEHPEKRRKIVKASYLKNKKHHKEVLNQYRKTDRFKYSHRKHGAQRRARMKDAFVERVDYKEIYTGICFYCGKQLSFEDTEFDHFVPISKGGTHETGNIVCACMSCNRRKGAMTPEEVCHQMV